MLTKPEELSANLNWRYSWFEIANGEAGRSRIIRCINTAADAVQHSPRINGIMPSEDPVDVDFEGSVSNAI
jgi:hypothetical protein